MEEQLRQIWDVPAAQAAAIVAAAMIAAKVIQIVIRRTLGAIAKRTASTLDDVIVDAVERPVFVTVLLIGLAWAARVLPVADVVVFRTDAVLKTLAVLVWSSAAFKIAMEILTVLARRSSATSIVQPRTVSIFQMVVKLCVVGAAIYFIFLAWRLDVTAWLASAGIVGIAIGFAAKDTLANLFSGIFIVADAPYKLGDYIVLDGGLRGKVTHIGIRSTRILTNDDVEITVPNAVIGGSKIVNESGGPSPSQRVGVSVDAAYGCDLDEVKRVLLGCPAGIAAIAAAPKPVVQLRELGASGLRFDLLVWIEDAAQRAAVIDQLNCAVYKAFAAAQIEIPYPKQDVYVRAMPG